MKNKIIMVFLLLIILKISPSAFSRECQVHFTAVGDLLLDRGIRIVMERKGKDYSLKEIGKYLAKQDIVLCNLEGPLSYRGEMLKKKYVFRGDPSLIDMLQEFGINVFSLANNHIMDYGKLALMDTINLIKSAELYPVGAGENQVEALTPVIIEKKGLLIAFFASLGFPLSREEICSDAAGPCQVRLDDLISLIQEIRDQVNLIIVSFHWGFEYSSLPHTHQIEDAHQLIDAGADLIIGHHPHVIQAIEKYHGKYILYSLGNFLFDQHDDEGKDSFLFSCILGKEGLIDPHIVPIEIVHYQTRIASEKKAHQIVKKIQLTTDQGILFFQQQDGKYYFIEVK